MELMMHARGRMMIKHPFFATLMATTPWEFTDRMPTAGTDMEKIYFNPDFIEKIGDVDKVMFVIAHEVMHIALYHGLRRGGRNPMLWNIACDFAINYILHDSGMTLLDGVCFDTQYAGMSADEIYDRLMRLADAARESGGSGDPGEDGMPGLDSMHGPDGDLMDPTSAGDPAKEAEQQRKIQQRVAQAASVARMAGKMAGSLEKLVSEILDPAVPWPELLRDYMTRISKDDESWQRRNRRYSHVYLPARHSQRMGEIVVIGDSSGSMFTDEQLSMMAAEIQAIADQVKPERIRVIWADTRVTSEEIFEEGELVLVKPTGGGGTDMRVPLRHVEQFDPHVVVMLTDGYTPWPSVEPSYPLIVCCNTAVDVPIGAVVRV